MPRDQFQRIKPGDNIPGLPSEPWNGLLDLLKGQGGGVPATGMQPTPVTVLVKNTTANPVGRFGVLQVNAPLVTYAQSQAEFLDGETVLGVAPAAGTPFVVLQEPLTAGAIGWARLLGLTHAKVTINATTDRYADCSTATDKLSSAAAGPARILWDEDNFAATGDKWALVNLLGAAPAAAAFSVQYIGSQTATNGPTSAGSLTATATFSSLADGTYLVMGYTWGGCAAGSPTGVSQSLSVTTNHGTVFPNTPPVQGLSTQGSGLSAISAGPEITISSIVVVSGGIGATSISAAATIQIPSGSATLTVQVQAFLIRII